MTWALVAVPLVVLLGLAAYWALAITEGVYLGPRVVAWLYDRTPRYYDRIKAITWARDDQNIVTPMLAWLGAVRQPLILDVGTGTGRFPAAMLAAPRFEGRVWGLDASIGMLRRAERRLRSYGERSVLIREDASVLPFPGETFDAVSCLEVLEFTPQPVQTLGELLRVLRPGGVLLLSNRIGRARWFPGRAYTDDQIIDLLCWHPLSKLEIHSWNTFYDQVWVRKAGEPAPAGRGNAAFWDVLVGAERYVERGGIVQRR
ncbi:MAG: class I SAM-dependent methyltransferase [Anaerolineae bacterium]|nr:class I SAM-dependent methyltransferase [Anaerolineae bacterium]